MELYTLTKDFFANERIDQFSSLIWTERFSSAGDVQLVVQPLPSVIAALTPGTMLGLRGQSEIMRVDTHTIKDGLLTVKGSSLVTFLNERVAFFPAIPSGDTGPIFGDRVDVTKTAGQFISQVVYDMVIAPVSFGTYWVGIDLDWNRDRIPNLYLGHIDGNGGARQMDFPLGPLYDGITQLASQEQVGFKLYLESATYSSRSYVLRFATYRGRNRTSEQSTNLMVRFSPSLDSLNGVQEVSSLVDYKNVIYVTYENQVTEHYPSYIDPANPPTGFDRRVLRVDAPTITLDPSHVAGFRDQVARDALAHHLYSQAVDGQVSAHRDYIFGRDYYLGDVIELQGYSGLISKARVTEYIRSQDQFGEQEYPTLAVLNPLDTQYTADLADDLYVPEWPKDPLFDDNWNPADIGNPDINLDPIKRHPLPPFTFPKYPTYPTPSFPYDFNQEPTPDLGQPGGTGGDGGGPGGGSDIGLTPIPSWQVADWFYDTDTGYYVHHGKVYVIGAASADGVDWDGSAVLLINIPAGIRPSSSVSSKVLIDHVNSTYEYAYDSGLHIGPWLDVTVHPDGTVTLDDGNPFRAPGSRDNYVYLSLILSSISWDTSYVSSDTYSPTGSLTDYVATAARIHSESGDVLPTDVWANVDGHYAAHEGRLHLDGKVKTVSSEWAESYDPLIGIPVVYQPKQAAGTSSWCEVPQKDGYRQIIYPPSGGYRHALSQSGGAQNPQAAGNNGCGFHKHVFYARHSDGYVSRGSTIELLYEPRLPDVDLYPIGCTGSPIGGLPSTADWRGTTCNAIVRFKPNDLIHTPDTVGTAKDLSAITGTSQFCFLIGLTPDAQSYYKVVFTWDPAVGKVSIRLILEGGYPSERASLMEVAYVPNLRPDGTTDLTWTLDISTNPGDTGYAGAILTGNFWRFTGSSGFPITDFANDAEDKVGMPAAQPGGKGDMGINIPSGTSCKVLSAEIRGIGTFPRFADNDVIDLTGCGWPLT